MSEREAFERILASLHEASLDCERWSTATGLIDDALRTHGSCMVFGDGTLDEDVQIYFAWCIMRGQRHRELERAYFEEYYRRDERVPRLRNLPEGRLFHNTQLYTEEERKTSTAYNELLARHHGANAINVRLDGPHRLGRQRPGRRGRLVVLPARFDPASPAPYPSDRARPAGAGRGRRSGRVACESARHHGVRHPAARRARADRGGERPRPGCGAQRRRSVRRG